jgi:excisionase family DNA binding protein
VEKKPAVPAGKTGQTGGDIRQAMERLKEVMTLREASQYLGISPDTLYKYIRDEKNFPAFKLGNRWRFKKDLLDRWIERKSERVSDVKPKRLAKAMKS